MKKLLSILVAVLILVGLVGCAASENTDQSGATKPAQNKGLTAEEAQNIALGHAELTADQVTSLHTRYEVDDGVPEYEVEFRYEDQEYDYTIHAETGEILDFDQEREPTVPTTAAPAENEPVQTPESEATKLTREQAQSIALEHAGLKADQVLWLQVEYELDDGVPEYSVEFINDGLEYDYTIHAETGKILENHREQDPEDSPAVVIPDQEPATTEPVKPKLSREEARDIALKHAGFGLDQVKGLEIEYDVDDGVPEYSVEFRVDDWELDYEIHAETGKILEHHKERD